MERRYASDLAIESLFALCLVSLANGVFLLATTGGNRHNQAKPTDSFGLERPHCGRWPGREAVDYRLVFAPFLLGI